MDNSQRSHILENLDYLIENTSNIRRLFIYMDAFNLLSLAERQVLLSFPDDESRLREMYTVLTQKDVVIYYSLIKSLQLSKNTKSANFLMQIQNMINGRGTLQNMTLFIGDEFQVLHRHVPLITEVLETVGIPPQDWDTITINLIEESYNDFVNCVSPSTAFKIMKTLDAWVEKNEKNATFSHLLSTISRTNKTASEILLTNKNEILQADADGNPK